MRPSTRPRLNTGLVHYLVRRGLQRQRLTWRDLNAEKRVLCPEEEAEQQAAVYLDGQLDRVKQVQEDTNWEWEMKRISARTVTHGASIAVKLENAQLIEGTLFAGGARIPLAWGSTSLRQSLRLLSLEQLPKASIPTTLYGSRYFGHRILDDMLAGLAAESAHLPPLYWVDDRRPRTEHVRFYLEALGLPSRAVRSASIDELWFFPHDFPLNSHKRRRLALLRERVQQRVTTRRTGHGVFFRRRGAGVPRGCVNERQLEERLEKEGFEIVDVAQQSAADVLGACRGASLFLGVDTSAFVHAFASVPADACFVDIQPPYRFCNYFKDIADALGMTSGFVVGEGSESAFEVSAEDLMRTIDLVRDEDARRRSRSGAGSDPGRG